MAGKRILIIEDEIITALSLQMTLQTWGYQCDEIIAEGQAAIDRTFALNPDLILVDIFLLDHIDGVEAVREIKKQVDIPVIYTTASNDKEVLARAQVTNPVAIIQKPYDFNRLKGVLHRYWKINSKTQHPL